jgi:hypothetical protein
MPVTVLAMQSANVLGLDAPPDLPKPTETDYEAKVRLILDAPGHNNNPPTYKFQSNSGWLVTPAECLKIADGIDRQKEMLALHLFPDEGYSAEEGRLWLTCWANFNRLAATHGGYRVL